jgi:hypothetical protein
MSPEKPDLGAVSKKLFLRTTTLNATMSINTIPFIVFEVKTSVNPAPSIASKVGREAVAVEVAEAVCFVLVALEVAFFVARFC